ncbi:hypothetical protein BJX68DRAFT_227235 [Aspergillus pseudodeflectus]|uniref:Uncharacterized protein n=1 Tax=Aspergillus pseudodeflectus TaxID=176178 RepID=A0ABR4L351_9EURO
MASRPRQKWSRCKTTSRLFRMLCRLGSLVRTLDNSSRILLRQQVMHRRRCARQPFSRRCDSTWSTSGLMTWPLPTKKRLDGCLISRLATSRTNTNEARKKISFHGSVVEMASSIYQASLVRANRL